jgi:hypothetical protein
VNRNFISFIFGLLMSVSAFAEAPSLPSDCGSMEAWDFSMGMCMPLAMARMPMKMAMLQYNSFITHTNEQGPRGRNAMSIPNMIMADVGSSIGDKHYLNLDVMGTFERWTFPEDGTPELLQIGEENARHEPFLDAQHPHSSPIMGLTLSDTVTLSGKDYLKFFAAPRGQATDGPLAFMHRTTGMVNPDAPLGHHVGQDVGHITSSVLGTALHLGSTTFEASVFNGLEPEPSQVDLPLGPLNSYAARITQEFTEHFYAMVSAAYVKEPEPHDPGLDHASRYSASLYNNYQFENGWGFYNTLIWGHIQFHEADVRTLNSFAEEFLFQKENNNLWSRIEYLQRTPSELDILLTDDNPRWGTAATVGYTRKFAKWDDGEAGFGGSLTKDFLPEEFRETYGGEPLTAKVFLQLSSMKMWSF